jgi:hypothetical protein
MLTGVSRTPQWWRYAAAAAAIAVLVGVPFYVWERNRAQTQSGSSSPATDASPAPPSASAPTPAATAKEYTVKAVLFRDRNGVETPVNADTSLRANDHLGMTIETSIPVYAYILNADDKARSYRLFPLPEHKLDNPLNTGIHRLPSAADNWTVTSEGGREHFVVIITPTQEDAIEAMAKMMPPVTAGATVERSLLPSSSTDILRSVGGLASRQSPVQQGSSERPRWFDDAEELTGNVERARGAWIRRVTVPSAR